MLSFDIDSIVTRDSLCGGQVFICQLYRKETYNFDLILRKMKFKGAPFKFCIRPVETLIDFDNEKKVFRGLFASPANFVFRMFRSYFNVSLIATNKAIKLVNKETGEYSGCFRKLQLGEADAAAFPLVMPVLNIPNITQVNISESDTGVYILAPYSLSSSDEYEVPDLIQQLNKLLRYIGK